MIRNSCTRRCCFTDPTSLFFKFSADHLYLELLPVHLP
jgi:hypothetical protein